MKKTSRYLPPWYDDGDDDEPTHKTNGAGVWPLIIFLLFLFAYMWLSWPGG